MSNELFPTLIGKTWDSKKMPSFNNITQTPVTGRDVSIALFNMPIWEFTLKNEWLTPADKEALIGFFLQRRGNFDTFLYADEDSLVNSYQFGTGDGSSTNYQLSKSSGGFIETVNNAAGAPAIYVNNVLQTVTTNYTINATGMVTFTVAPTSGYSIKWTGTAYYRSKFSEGMLEYNQFMNRLYVCDEITFKGALVNKL